MINTLVGEIIAGAATPTNYAMGVKEDCIYIAPNDSVYGNLPQEEKDLITSFTEKLRSGEINADDAVAALPAEQLVS